MSVSRKMIKLLISSVKLLPSGFACWLITYHYFVSYTKSAVSFLLDRQVLVPHFEKGVSIKNECLGEFLKEFLPCLFAWGELTMFLVKNKT